MDIFTIGIDNCRLEFKVKNLDWKLGSGNGERDLRVGLELEIENWYIGI